MSAKYISAICLLFSLVVIISCKADETTPKAYMIVEIKVNDNELYSKYIEKVSSVVKKYGGQYLIRGGRTTPLSGNWNPERIVLIEFDSVERIQECLTSPEYLKLAPLREQSTTGRAIIAEGYVHGDGLSFL